MWVLSWGLFFVLIKLSEQVIWELPDDFDRDTTNKYVNDILQSQSFIHRYTECNRTCVAGESRVCYQEFHVEHYQAMGAACGNCSIGVLDDCYLPQCVTADGTEKAIITINRNLPGPPIEVCQGDLIVIDAFNQFYSDTLTIHWHGLHQRGTPHMDGVPYLTQCPIQPMSSFRYTYFADGVGTHFYHSHSGVQRYIGLFGSIIIRAPPTVENFPDDLYDEDKTTLVLNDWSHESSEMFLIGLPTRPPGNLPVSILINGRGKFEDEEAETTTNSPYDTIYVEPSKKYRIRVISAISMACPIELQIQNHTMKVIAIDGHPIVPVDINTLIMGSGERYDIVIEANQPEDLYWIHTRLTGVCEFGSIKQMAVLSYIRTSKKAGFVPKTKPRQYDRGVALNDPIQSCRVIPDNLCLTDLERPIESDLANLTADATYYLSFGVRKINDTRWFFNQNEETPFWDLVNDQLYLTTINGISFTAYPSPLLTLPSLDDVDLCNYDSMPSRCENLTICRCTHAITVKYNQIIDIVLIDESAAKSPVIHPIHFHGMQFTLLGQGEIPNDGPLTVEQVKELDEQGKLWQNSSPNPILKDTVFIQSQGYVALRFKADNPGMWFAHCHVDDHAMFGMAFALVVEGPIPNPPPNFPTCQKYP